MPKPSSTRRESSVQPAGKASDDALLRDDSAAVWNQFGELFELLERLIEEQPTTKSFYDQLLSETVAGFAATAGRVWQLTENGQFQLLSHAGLAPNGQEQNAYEQLLAKVANSKQLTTTTIGTNAVTVVRVESSTNRPQAFIEIVQRSGCRKELYEATEELLRAVSRLATEYHAKQQLADMAKRLQSQQAVLGLAHQVAGDLRIGPTSYRIVNECRRLLAADRVSLLQLTGKRCKLLAVSGVEQPDRRSNAARSLVQLSKIVADDKRPMLWATDTSTNEHHDFPAECLEQLDAYADTTHVRSLIGVPLFAPKQINESASDLTDTSTSVEAVLIVESFDSEADCVDVELAQQAAQACSPALNAAIQTPFASLQRQAAGWLRPSRWVTLLILSLLLLGLGYVSMVLEVEHTVTLRGQVVPVEQREIYAPADARVAKIFVEGGQQIEQGQPLLQLRDPSSLLELQKLEGELLATQRQHDAVEATRASLDRSSTSPSEFLRLTAEQQRLALKQQSLQDEIKLVKRERGRLMIVSPLSGTINTWQPGDLLENRPVQRGQRLLTLIDHSAGWKLEVETPDDRLGLLRAAEEKTEEPLLVVYELASEPSLTHWGKITKYAPIATASESDSKAHGRMVRVEVSPEDELVNPLPGVSVRAEVQCGKQSLAYVAFHDVWHFLSTRWQLGW